jgi:hypothetical protein
LPDLAFRTRPLNMHPLSIACRKVCKKKLRT